MANFFSRLFSGSQNKENAEQERQLLANFQKEVSNSGFDAEAHLIKTLELLKEAWQLNSLDWIRDSDSNIKNNLEITFAGNTIGNIKWEAETPPSQSQINTLEILTGLAAPYLAQINNKEFSPLQHWHAERVDSVTGLLNQTNFLSLLNDTLNKPASLTGLASALITIQIKNNNKLYKELGGSEYDKHIQSFSNLIKTHFGVRSTAGRLEDDLFIVLLSDLATPDKAAEMSSSFSGKAEEKFKININVGIAPQVETYADPKIWLNDARTALKQAKDGGGQQAFFSETMQMHSIARWRMEADLENALKQNQIETWFQPIVDLSNRQIAGYEALCRWTHPERGPISPAEFIPVAENDGPLILEIGKLTLKQAAQTLSRVMTQNSNPVFMSVNLSPVQLLKDKRLTQYIKNIFDEFNIPPERLKLEVTETAMMHEKDKAIAALNRIKQTGAKISMDDFGTGYSSLAHLKDFPINTLKIDRAFVSGAHLNEEAQAILQTIAEMAHSLNLDIVAEGVETEEELLVLEGLGCEYGQGWLFSKPLPANEI